MLNESLRSDDLRGFVKKVFEIDAFRSKIGDDENIVVVSFTVDHEDPAKDLENFIEMGYDFVMDADVSPGELDDGTYRVYVELERTRHVAKQIREILDGVEKLSGQPNMRFRYFKSFKSKEATEENLAGSIPMDRESYNIATERNKIDNFSSFFSNSYVDDLEVVDESITFKRIYKDPISFEIIESGPKSEVYSSVKGPIMLESNAVAEAIYLTKYVGDYNITKVGEKFIFENNGWAVALERKK